MTLSMVLAACGGGGDGGSGGGGRAQLTDPASAPTATPVPDDQAMVIQVGDGATGGTVTTIDEGNGSTNGGGSSGDSGSGRTYTVVAGDTCIGIASNNGVTVEALQEANSDMGDVCSSLFPDMSINLPAAPRDDSNDDSGDDDSSDNGDRNRDDNNSGNGSGSGSTEEIQAGDTCGAIASRLGVTDDELQDANPGLDCSYLIAGTTVNVP